jgi:hypothetical protein
MLMRVAITLVLTVHALIHLMGFCKAFGYAALPQLVLPISRPVGLLWLLATLLLLAAAVTLWVVPRAFWVLGALGLVVSQAVIFASWGDARWGTLANAAVLAAVVYAAFAWGPWGLGADYSRRCARALGGAGGQPGSVITEADLAPLPMPVQRYLRYAGVVGQPRVLAFQVRMTGRIRSAANAPWMPFTAEQTSVIHPPQRYFFMQATRAGLPIDGLHAYAEDGASMHIKLLSVFPLVDLKGPVLTRTETVTVLNDMAIMAPAALIDPAIRWREIDERQVEASFTNGSNEVRAVLVFDTTTGALVDFWSDDRPALAADGVTLQPQRWSTPVGGYRQQGGFRLVPIMMSTDDPAAAQRLASALVEVIRRRRSASQRTLLVASSDLHHIENYDQVVLHDRAVVEAVAAFDLPTLTSVLMAPHCSVCGRMPILTMLHAARALGADAVKVLHHTNSGDVTGQRWAGQYTVGYMAAAVYRSNPDSAAQE